MNEDLIKAGIIGFCIGIVVGCFILLFALICEYPTTPILPSVRFTIELPPSLKSNQKFLFKF